VGKIKANDEDLGVNAEMRYSITNAEGKAMFSITTDTDQKEGIISLRLVQYSAPLHSITTTTPVLMVHIIVPFFKDGYQISEKKIFGYPGKSDNMVIT
jgi:hypothetical protein